MEEWITLSQQIRLNWMGEQSLRTPIFFTLISIYTPKNVENTIVVII